MKHIIVLAIGLALALPLQAGKKPAGGKDRPKPSAAQVFKKKDKDSDGFLSKEEFNAKTKKAAKVKKAFDNKDKNSDGKLSKAEFTGTKNKAAKKNKAPKKEKAVKKAKAKPKEKGRQKTLTTMNQTHGSFHDEPAVIRSRRGGGAAGREARARLTMRHAARE